MHIPYWLRWLKIHHVQKPEISYDDYGLFWVSNTKKKQIDWFKKYQPFHHKEMPKKHHKLIQAIHGRIEYKPLVLDACAGLGYDSFLMSLSGCDVIACEKNPQVFALLADMYSKADKKDWKGKARIKIVFGCALKIMKNWPAYRIRPDVIYLDPMFDKNFKGQVKANAALLKSLVDVENTDQMFELAISLARLKVVVKRPLYADQLSKVKPTYRIEGKTTRYDVYQVG